MVNNIKVIGVNKGLEVPTTFSGEKRTKTPNNPPEAPSISQATSSAKKMYEAERKKQEFLHPVRTRIKKGIGKALDKAYKTKATYRSITRKGPQATVVIGGEVYSKDRSRFFKQQWEEEKKQLYFK